MKQSRRTRLILFALAGSSTLSSISVQAQSAPALDGGVVLLDAGTIATASDDAAIESDAAPATAASGDAALAFEAAPPPPYVEPFVSEPALAPIAVEVRGRRTSRARLTKSAEAVTVVNLAQARKRSADLGEVLNRVAGVSIRRYGGLGSEFRLSINGLYDNAVRVFVDGVPIDRVYATGLANVPVNLAEDVEIYRGVVPLRFGADALGGAINITRPKRYETAAQASYQIGSFGTHRATLNGRYRHDETGLVGGVDAFYDRTDNDYLINVEIPDERGQLSSARVRKFNDGYQAYGVAGEVGFVDEPWARKLLVRGFTSAYTKEIPHNVVMTVPYGEARSGAAVTGAILDYENTFAERLDLAAIASYAYRVTDFVDKAQWVYDWRGRRTRMRRIPGEIEARGRDQSTWQHGAFARATLDWRIAAAHVLSASLSPTFATRSGDERIQANPNDRDPLTAERKLLKTVAGLAYTLGAGELARAPRDPKERRTEHHRLENVLFAKAYVYRADAEDPLPGNVFVKRAKHRNLVGAGDSLRLTLIEDWLLLKGSYEYAIRLPEADEVLGDAILTLANLALEPERSHNANLGLQLDKRRTPYGDFWLDVNLFARRSDQMIVRLAQDRYYSYHNIYRGRSLGIEGMVKWSAPRELVTVEGQVTYTDQRNVSERGTFGDFAGDRIPNRPWLTASWGSFLHFSTVFVGNDAIEPFYQGRFVGEFYRGWESAGMRAYKDVVPQQISHDLGITYALTRDEGGRLFATFDVQNVTDALLYDTFGVLRPSRGFFFKLTGDI